MKIPLLSFAFAAILSFSTTISAAANASTILSEIESAATCAACEGILGVLQTLAHVGNDAFVDTITELCILTGSEDADVCTGAVAREGPILAHSLRNMDIISHTAELFCSTVFGLCDYPAVRDYTVTFPEPKPATTRPVSSGQSPIKVVHFSDIHVDLEYETGANYNCTKNICCRPYTAEDAPGNTSYPAGPNGNHLCDSPRTLETSLYAAIQEFASDAAFALFTGDVVEGAVWLVTDDEVTTDLDNAYSLMSSKLGTPIYAATGNHDAAPVNSFPPSTIDTTISSQYVYDTEASAWTQWLNSSTASVVDEYGAYAYTVPGHSNLRIISFNTNFWYKENFWLYEETMQYDPNSQLAWLISELQAAETASQRVYIIGHMPLGAGDAFHDQSHYLDQILNRYEATIAAAFFGHTHKDEFEITYSDASAKTASTAVLTSYIAPALTPTSGAPAFRVYSVDPVTFGILDMTTYTTDLSAATYQTSSGPVWSEYYSAKSTYGPLVGVTAASAELTPAFWHELTTVFETNDAAFQDYYARKSRGYDVSTCTGDCKTDEICQLRAAEAQYNCVTVSPGINFRKREAGESVKHDSECHGSTLKDVFSALAGSKP